MLESPGIPGRFNPVRPVRIQRLQVLMAFFDDQLLEGRFLGVFQTNHDVAAADRGDLGIHEDELAVVELGFHALTAHPQDKRVRAAPDRAREQILGVAECEVAGDFGQFAGLHPGD